MGKVFGREPALVIAAFGAVVQCAVAFGLDLTADQQVALSAVVLAVVALVTRQRVTPV